MSLFLSAGCTVVTFAAARILLGQTISMVALVRKLVLGWTIAINILGLGTAQQDANDLPTVDLGYEIHRAYSYNVC